MENSMSFGKGSQIASVEDGYDLEDQLATAERRYAETRALSHKLREERRALEIESNASVHLISQARTRHEAVEARCTRLRQLINTLEERLG